MSDQYDQSAAGRSRQPLPDQQAPDQQAPDQQAPEQKAAGQQAPERPETGQPEVDRALESLQGLENEPLSVHHDRLAQAHEDLHRALNTDAENPS